jgi:hypothetical protein
MEDIVKSFSGPWMIIRDLNCISSSEDKMGGGGGGGGGSECWCCFYKNSQKLYV